MSHRLHALQNHLAPHPCIGESANLQVDTRAPKFRREAIKIAFSDPSVADERYGGSGDVVVVEGELLLPPTKSDTVIVFMHPSGIQNLLPMPNAMARAGLHVATCTSRYPNNDSCLIMEKVVLDLAACVKHLKEKLKYANVVLAGWSGGGSLSSFYQACAERQVGVFTTPAGDKVDMTGIVPANGLLILAAHMSRARIFTEWLDPAVLDENDPSVRDPSLDLWNPAIRPPYTAEFMARFREGQIARNRRITLWALQKLASLEHDKAPYAQGRRDFPFNVRSTQADPLRLDLTKEPNGRKPTTLLELAQENHSPVGLARFTTCRSWLSQWSYDLSNADGPRSLELVTVPVLVLANTADHLVPLTHPRAMYAALRKTKLKRYVEMEGATHYYFGQHDLMNQAVNKIKQFLSDANLLKIDAQYNVVG